MGRAKVVHSFESYADDFVVTKDQSRSVPEAYRWIRSDAPHRAASAALYAAGLAFAAVYTRAVLHVRVEDARTERPICGKGCVLMCNHTQPVGDAFLPARALFPQRVYVVASSANLGIPVLGKLLPALGILPIPDRRADMRAFKDAVSARLRQGCCVVVYPEAHVWPYYTGVRPFPATSFAFAVDADVPVCSLTLTYQEPHRAGGRPRATAYLDGPFYPRADLGRRRAREELCSRVRACMEQRSQKSVYEHIRYERVAPADDPHAHNASQPVGDAEPAAARGRSAA